MRDERLSDQALVDLRESLHRTAHLLELYRLNRAEPEDLLQLKEAQAPLTLREDLERVDLGASDLSLLQALRRPGATPESLKRNEVIPNKDADERIVKFARSFVKALQAHGVPARCTEVYRGKERQNALKAQGRSRASFGQSAHNYGMACDVIHADLGWDMNRVQWALFGIIGKEIARRQHLSLVWGGDWDFWDPAHWELADWRVSKEAKKRVDIG